MLRRQRLRSRLGPWRRRPTKTQLAALALITILSFGPIVAVIAVISRDSGPVEPLSKGTNPPLDGARVAVSLTAVSPVTGTMTALVQVEPFSGLLGPTGLKEDLVLRVNDARGDTAITFPARETLRAVSVALPLRDGSIIRYPFDRYQSAILMRLEQGTGPEPRLVPFTVDVSSQLGDFDIHLDNYDDGRTRAAPAVGVRFELNRTTTTTIYTVGIMVLMWGLALAGVAILWAVTMWEIEVPVWSFGYLVGVLFALSPLRSSLPGSPPPGTLLDFVAFYWSIALVGLTLIMVMAVWLQRARPRRRKPDGADAPDLEEPPDRDPA